MHPGFWRDVEWWRQNLLRHSLAPMAGEPELAEAVLTGTDASEGRGDGASCSPPEPANSRPQKKTVDRLLEHRGARPRCSVNLSLWSTACTSSSSSARAIRPHRCQSLQLSRSTRSAARPELMASINACFVERTVALRQRSAENVIRLVIPPPCTNTTKRRLLPLLLGAGS